MFVIVNAEGKFWDGYGWNAKGKIFCTIGGATRSLYEEGESIESTSFLPIDNINYYDTAEKFSTRCSKIAET